MRYILMLCLMFLIGCTHNEFDSTYYAKSYCNCMIENNEKGIEYMQSIVLCDAKLVRSNMYFRTFFIEDNYGRYMATLSESFRDSVVKFRYDFLKYLEENCCKYAVKDCDTTNKR